MITERGEFTPPYSCPGCGEIMVHAGHAGSIWCGTPTCLAEPMNVPADRRVHVRFLRDMRIKVFAMQKAGSINWMVGYSIRNGKPL